MFFQRIKTPGIAHCAYLLGEGGEAVVVDPRAMSTCTCGSRRRTSSPSNTCSRRLYVGYLEQHLGKLTPPLRKSKRIAVTCSVGHRASLAASILRRAGFEQVDNVLGGMTAWEKAGLPLEKGHQRTITTRD